MSLELRAEFFNIFNRLYLASPTPFNPTAERHKKLGGRADRRLRLRRPQRKRARWVSPADGATCCEVSVLSHVG